MHFTRRTVLFAAGLAAGCRFRLASAQETTRVLVVGDSQAQGLAGGLVRQYRRDKAVQIEDHSHIASGLLTPNRYNWPEAIGGIAAEGHGAIAVVMFGANDRPPIRPHGSVDAKKCADFRESYAAKVRTIVTPLKTDCKSVIWIGHPVVREAVYAEDMTLLNEIYKAEAENAGAGWFPSWNMFCGEGGVYDAYGKGVDGQTTRLRADDGVHLSPAGYDVLARAVMPLIAERATSESPAT